MATTSMSTLLATPLAAPKPTPQPDNTFVLAGVEQIAKALGDAAIASANANLSFAQSLDKISKLLPILTLILVLGLAVGFSKKGI